MANIAGTERVMSDKMNWLAEHGHVISLVTYEQGEHPLSFPLYPSVRIFDLNTPFYKLSRIPLILRLWEFYKMRKEFKKKLQGVVEDVKPDIIDVTSYSIKLINEVINLDSDARIIMESHATCYYDGKEFDYRANPIMRLIGRFYDMYNYRNLNKLNSIIALTEGDKCDWSKYSDHVIVLPNPLTYYPNRLFRNENSHRILCVGRLNKQKGFDLLIDAFSLIASKCPDWYVDIYGNGEEKTMLLHKIISEGLEGRVNIYNPINSIYEEYPKSAFLVLSSRYESFGLVLIEAMSCGLPCVAFNCKFGPSDIIRNGIDGLLVHEGDVQDLADKMMWMINHNNDCLEFGRNARIMVKRYCIDVIMPKWKELFESLCRKE